MHSEINGFEVEQWNVHGFQIAGKTTGKVYSTCPFCSAERKKKNDKCASVYLDTGYFKCNHCGEEGQLHTYKRKNQDKTYVKPSKEVSEPQISKNITEWFESRKINVSTLQRLLITQGKEWMPQTKKDETVVKFNYFLQGELINIKYRDARKNFKLFKGAEKIMYNLDAIFRQSECVIVEGEIDVCSFYEAGVTNVVSVPNGFNDRGEIPMDYLTSCYEYFDDKEKIFLAVDNDQAGRLGERELARRLGVERIWLVDFKDCKDANEYLIKYGKDKLKLVLEEAVQYPLEYVTTAKDLQPELKDFYLNGNKEGYKIGLSSFDDIFSVYLGQCIAVTGIPSSGKSDFVDQMCVGYNQMHGWKIAYASPENLPVQLHSDKILRKFAGFTPETEGQLDSKNWQEVLEHVDKNFFHITFDSGYELKRTLKKCEELIKRKGVRVIVLDPFNKIRLHSSLKSNITEYTNDYLNELDQFARKHNILLIIVAHPTKMPRKADGSGAREEPDMYSIKGGGEWYDMMPNGILVHRDYVRKIVKVKVLKVKFSFLGENQAEAFYGWNFNNGRYTEFDGEVNEDTIHLPPFLWDNRNYLTNQDMVAKVIPKDEFEEETSLPVASPAQAFDLDHGVLADDEFGNDNEVPF